MSWHKKTKKMRIYYILLLSICIISCKKEEQTDNSKDFIIAGIYNNNVSFADTSINKEIITKNIECLSYQGFDSIYLWNNSERKIVFYTNRGEPDTSFICCPKDMCCVINASGQTGIDGRNANIFFLADSSYQNLFKVQLFKNGDTIHKTNNNVWQNIGDLKIEMYSCDLESYSNKTCNEKLQGDVFIAIKINEKSKEHFGWIQLNFNQKITIKGYYIE